MRPKVLKRLSKTKKHVSRAYGGSMCAKCVRDRSVLARPGGATSWPREAAASACVCPVERDAPPLSPRRPHWCRGSGCGARAAARDNWGSALPAALLATSHMGLYRKSDQRVGERASIMASRET